MLARSALSLDLTVNLEKSDIVVFRNGGPLARHEKWFYDGVAVNVVNSYKYLGVFLSSRLSFAHACDDLASRAKKAVYLIFRALWKFGDFSLPIFFKLFDSQVTPILLYASEIWGLQIHDSIEKVHLFALKKLLQVSPRTPNTMVYGETGRYPLYINAYVNCIKYWLRLTRLSSNRLPRKAYNMLLSIHDEGKHCWVTDICHMLCRHGLGFVWLNQGVQNVNMFLRTFRQRLVDCFRQGWHSHVDSSDRFSIYKIFKLSHEIEPYFRFVPSNGLRKFVIRFRLGISDLRTHRLRYYPHEQCLDCPLCHFRQDDEMHFLFHCQALSVFRQMYIPAKYCRFPSFVNMRLLLNDTENLSNLARFLYHGFKLRKCLAPSNVVH